VWGESAPGRTGRCLSNELSWRWNSNLSQCGEAGQPKPASKAAGMYGLPLSTPGKQQSERPQNKPPPLHLDPTQTVWMTSIKWPREDHVLPGSPIWVSKVGQVLPECRLLFVRQAVAVSAQPVESCSCWGREGKSRAVAVTQRLQGSMGKKTVCETKRRPLCLAPACTRPMEQLRAAHHPLLSRTWSWMCHHRRQSRRGHSLLCLVLQAKLS